MSAEMPKMPEPVAFYETEGDEWHIYPRGTSTYEHIRDHQKARIGVHVFALYTAAQLQEAARLAMERCAALCDAKYLVRHAQGLPREASTARNLRDAIRALIPQDPDHLAGVGNMVDGKDQSEKRHG